MIKPSFRSFGRKALVSILIPVALFAGTVRAGSKEIVRKFSTEITYVKDKDIIKFRPFDYSSPDTQRTDFLFGRKFGDFTGYLYMKADNKERSWMGARVDKKLDLGEKLNASLQFRYFLGLNEGSANQFYFIPTVDYKINDTLGVGILGYAKKDEGKEPFFYVGPSLGIRLTENLSTKISYDFDTFENKGSMIFWKLNWRF